MIFAVVSMALLMASIDATIVSIGLPAIESDLHTSLAWVGWTLTGYLLTQIAVMPLAGKLSDDFGRKRLFMAAVVVFTASSLAVGLAPNIQMLIVFRVLQAVGGGAFLPSATGIVSDAFGQRRQIAIGLFTSILPIGSIIGPNLGGLIIDHLTWRWMFFVNVPIGVALLVSGLRFLPAGSRAATKRGIDVAGALLFAGGLACVLFGLTIWASNADQIFHPTVWLLFGLGIASLGFFLWHEARAVAPLVELRLLTSRPFLAANVYNLILGSANFGVLSFVPYYAIVGYGMTAQQTGAMLTPRSLAISIMSVFSSFAIIRSGYRIPMIIGILSIAASLFLLSFGYHNVVFLGVALSNPVLLALELLVAGTGMGIAAPASNNAALDILPEKVAAVAGLRGMFRYTGGVFGTTILVLIISHYGDKGAGIERVFLIWGFLMLLAVPTVFFIPDMARLRRQKAQGAVTQNEGEPVPSGRPQPQGEGEGRT